MKESPNYIVETNNLVYAYAENKSIRFPDLKVMKGEACLLLGESGCGKTTWLHLLSGLLRSQQGSIKIDGTEITALSISALDYFRGKHAGFIFQKDHLIT